MRRQNLPKTKTNKQLAEEKRKRRLILEVVYGQDNFEESTVVRFYKAYDSPEEVYTFLGMKINEDTWAVGLKDGMQYWTWMDMLLFLDEDNLLEHEGLLEFATGWEEYDNQPPF
jgi:hypothetical protein